jgi:hypothetical protein
VLLQTKKLWLDRLQREKKAFEGSSAPIPFPKAPKKLVIEYPFSSSPLLQEQVGASMLAFKSRISDANLKGSSGCGLG